MKKRVVTRAVILAMLLAMVLLFGADGLYAPWVDLKTGLRLVRAFSVLSQPEIVFCGALGQQPDMDGVVFRLEYRDGSTMETEFVYHGMARYKPSLAWCNPPYYAYGMLIPALIDSWRRDAGLPLGRSKLEIRFDNARTVHTWEGDGIVDSTMPRAYVDIYNQTVGEYLRENPPVELKPGQPARTSPIREYDYSSEWESVWDIFSFTADKDGTYQLHLSVEEADSERQYLWLDLSQRYIIDMLEGENELRQLQGVDFELPLRRGESVTLFYEHPMFFNSYESIEFTITPT